MSENTKEFWLPSCAILGHTKQRFSCFSVCLKQNAAKLWRNSDSEHCVAAFVDRLSSKAEVVLAIWPGLHLERGSSQSSLSNVHIFDLGQT